jgi:hypothetical protein
MKLTIRDLLWLILVCAVALSWRSSDGERVAELKATLDRHHRVRCAPRLFQEHAFTAASLADAVNHFVGLGEDAAMRELQEIAQAEREDCYSRGGVYWSMKERVGWMCRILFESKDGRPLREPYFGALDLPYHSMPNTSWPLYPVALSGSTYFVLSEGYWLAGVAEDINAYIAYCRQTGAFRRTPVAVPTRAQAMMDAAVLRASPAWQAIKWTDSGQGWSYTLNEDGSWEFIHNQAAMIR